MELFECLRGRRSVRKFEARQVDDTLLRELIELAAFAPSWKNTQTARYLAVKDPATKEYLADYCVSGFEHNRGIIRGAPAVIVLSTVTGRSGFERDGGFSTTKGAHWQSFDAGIAVGALCLAAWGLGLGTVILGIFDEERIMERVKLPAGQAVSALVAIGYPAEAPAAPKRKTTEELLTIL